MTQVSLRSPVLGTGASGTRSSKLVFGCSQVKTEATDGYAAVQVGYQVCKERKVTKPELNHLKKAGAPAMRRLTEFKVSGTSDRFLQQVIELLQQGAEDFPPVGNRSATQKNTAQGSSLEWRNCSTSVTSWTSRERALAKAFKVGCDLTSRESDHNSYVPIYMASTPFRLHQAVEHAERSHVTWIKIQTAAWFHWFIGDAQQSPSWLEDGWAYGGRAEKDSQA